MPFIQIVTDQGVQEAVPLDRYEPLTIGSHYTNTIVIDEPGVGTLYARILWNKKMSGFELTSASGEPLRLSGQLVTNSILTVGNELVVGSKKLIYQDYDEPVQPVSQAKEKQTPQPDEEVAVKESAPAAAAKEAGAAVVPPPAKSDGKNEASENFQPVQFQTKTSESPEESLQEWISKSRRPGERDPLRSPLITTLTIICFMLAIAAGAFYLLIGRQTAQADFQAARQDQVAGKYGPAIERYEQFLAEFPSSKMAPEARREWGYCQMELAIGGVGADYARALDWVKKFIEAHRGEADFADQSSRLKQYCFRIATLSYNLASRKHDPVWLETGDEAERYFQRFKATDGSDEDEIAAIAEASRQSRADLLEFTVKQESLAAIDRDLTAGNLTAVLATYRQAVDRYPHFQKNSEFTTRVQQALVAEQKRVRPIDVAATNGSPVTASIPSLPAYWPYDLKRTRFDVQSDGINKWVLSEGVLFAIDRLTGKLQWNLILGDPVSFEPLDLNLYQPHWLISTTSGYGIAAVNCETGALLWQSVLPEACRFQPTIMDDQVLVVAGQQKLISLSLTSGQMQWITQFPQPIAAPATFIQANELIVPGEADVAYLLDSDTGNCQQVRYLGQAPGSVAGALYPIGAHLLLFEMDQPTRGRIRVLKAEADDWYYDLVQSERLPGIIAGQPIIWGARLFLETYGPRIAAWQLSDAPGQPVLKRITIAPVPFSEQARLFFHPIEGDRLFLAGENLREMTLLTDTFEQQAHALQLGNATQSLQSGGPYLIAAGSQHPALGKTVFLYDYTLEETYWRMALGTQPSLLFPLEDSSNGIGFLDSAGHFFQTRTPPSNTETWLSPSETLMSGDNAAADPPHVLTPGLAFNSSDKLASFGNQVIRWKKNLAKRETMTLTGKPTIPPVTTDEYLFWADAAGLHAINWKDRQQKIASSLAAVQADSEQAVRWKRLLPLNEKTICGLSEAELGIWQVEMEPTPHLQQIARRAVDATARDFCLQGDSLFVTTEERQLLEFGRSNLQSGETRELSGLPLRGPWSTPVGLLLQLDDGAIIKISPDSNPPQKSEPLPALLTLPPQVHPQGQRLFLENGQIALLEISQLKWSIVQQLPAPPCSSPVRVDQGEYLGLKNGSLIFLPDE